MHGGGMKDLDMDALRGVIGDGIQLLVQEAIEREIKSVAERVEKDIRGRVGEIAANVTSLCSFERFGMDLRITVHFPEARK